MKCYSFFKNKTFYFVVRHIFLIFGEECGGLREYKPTRLSINKACK